MNYRCENVLRGSTGLNIHRKLTGDLDEEAALGESN